MLNQGHIKGREDATHYLPYVLSILHIKGRIYYKYNPVYGRKQVGSVNHRVIFTGRTSYQ